MGRSRVAFVIPALNEEHSITNVVVSLLRHGTPIVVNDGSTDSTSTRAREAGAIVVDLPCNRGYDGALEAGFAEAAARDFDYAVTFDADGQHNPKLVEEFVSELDRGAEVVSGVRDRRQRLGEHLFAWVTKMAWGINDPLCGMKAYRMSIYRELGHFDCYRSIGTELLLHAVRNGYKVSQIPVNTFDRDGQPRFGRRLNANLRIMRALLLGLLPSLRPNESKT